MANFFTDVIENSPQLKLPVRIDALDLLEPVFRGIVAKIVADALAEGIELQVFETYRSRERQQRLYDAGATELRTVGVHHYGLACDLVKVVSGELTWKGDYSFLGRLARDRGLIWGGDWGRPSMPHSFVDSVHVQRCAPWRQASLFRGEWYPEDGYDAIRDSAVPAESRSFPTARTMPMEPSLKSVSRTTLFKEINMSGSPTEAGQGESHVYRIAAKTTDDQTPLTKDEDYLGIDAMTWYVNKEGSWFHDRTASGVLTINMDNGAEKYQTSLGTFELSNGQKTAPVFGTAVLPDRNYVGGSIAINVTLSAILRNTVLGGLINSAASAGLGIIEGMVRTASVTGPAQVLTAAGDQLITGIKKALDDPSVKSEPLFDANGIQVVLQPTDIKGPEGYLLIHRGAPLDESKLTLGNVGVLSVPLLNGQPLTDGAWLLLRLRSSKTYSGVRDWETTSKKLREDVQFTVDSVTNGAVAKDTALKEFGPGTGGAATLWDRFAALRGVITEDGVISEAEAQGQVAKLIATLTAAKKAIQATGADGSPSAHFEKLVSNYNDALLEGGTMEPTLLASLVAETQKVADVRSLARHESQFDSAHPQLEKLRGIGTALLS